MEETANIGLGERKRDAIIEDARARAKRRRLVAALVAAAAAVVGVVLLAGGDDGSGPSGSPQRGQSVDGSESPTAGQTTVDGVPIFTSVANGVTLYSFKPLPEAKVAALEQLPVDSIGPDRGLSTGDFAACKFLLEQPGEGPPGCAMTLAQKQNGDLDLVEGPAKRAFAVCGREPLPGEYEACGKDLIPESEIRASLERLNAALRQEK